MIERSWQGEPSVEELSGVIGELEDFKPDYILALGGGSIIDGAKLAWLFYECQLLNQNFYIDHLHCHPFVVAQNLLQYQQR